MPKRDLDSELQVLEEKIDEIAVRLRQFEQFDESIERTVESKVFEIKALAYVILIIVSVLLAFVVGAAVKLFMG